MPIRKLLEKMILEAFLMVSMVRSETVITEINLGNVYVVRCAIWYHLYNLKNVKNTHGRVLFLVKLQAEHTSMGVFIFFKLCKWYQIVQHITFPPAPILVFSKNSNNPTLQSQFFSQDWWKMHKCSNPFESRRRNYKIKLGERVANKVRVVFLEYYFRRIGITLLFEHSPSRASEIEHSEILSRPREN